MPVDVVLINPPWPVPDGRATLQNSLPPLGILSIAASLEKAGYRVKVYDVHAEKLDDETLKTRLKSDWPTFVGLSVLTPTCVPAHKIARLCKEVLPGSPVVVGGVHAEAMPERMLRNSAIDAVVRGDGEDAMGEIVAGRPFTSILGLSFREEGKVRHTPARPIDPDIDRHPFPAYHLVDFTHYFPAAGSYRRLPAINMLMTRGCPGQCTFCNSARTSLRARSPERVVAQIEHLYHHYGIRQIQFYDDTFTVLKAQALRFCHLLAERNLDLAWTAYIRGDCFSADMARAMKAAGCHQVLMGVETGSPRIAAAIGKPIDRQRYRDAVRIAHAHGLEVRASFIIGNLGETLESMEETLDFAMELDVDLFQLNISTPYPGSALYNQALERGWLNSTDWYDYGQSKVLVDQPQLSGEQILAFERQAFRRFYLRPRAMLRLLKRIASFRHLRDYFQAALIFLLGRPGRSVQEGHARSWNGLAERDFLDLDLPEPEYPRLTFELRQGAEFA